MLEKSIELITSLRPHNTIGTQRIIWVETINVNTFVLINYKNTLHNHCTILYKKFSFYFY